MIINAMLQLFYKYCFNFVPFQATFFFFYLRGTGPLIFNKNGLIDFLLFYKLRWGLGGTLAPSIFQE